MSCIESVNPHEDRFAAQTHTFATDFAEHFSNDPTGLGRILSLHGSVTAKHWAEKHGNVFFLIFHGYGLNR